MLPLIMVVLTNKNGRFGQYVVVVFSSRRHKGNQIGPLPLSRDLFGFKLLFLDRFPKSSQLDEWCQKWRGGVRLNPLDSFV